MGREQAMADSQTKSVDSVINVETGEVEQAGEYLANLRELEQQVQRYDENIVLAKETLKRHRAFREECIAALRSAIRKGTVLPLLETDPGEE